MKVLFSNLINFSLIATIFSFIFLKKELAIFFLAFALLASLISLFIINSHNKKIYFLIVILLGALIFFVNSERQKSMAIREKINLENIKLEEDRKQKEILELEKQNNFNLEASVADIYESIKIGSDKSVILDKAYAMIAKAKSEEDIADTKSFLDLGKAYEVAALVGVPGASELAFTNYNKYCNLEPKDSACYITLAKFLLLDKTKKKEALRIIRFAIPLSKNEEETKNIKDIIAYINSIK